MLLSECEITGGQMTFSGENTVCQGLFNFVQK